MVLYVLLWLAGVIALGITAGVIEDKWKARRLERRQAAQRERERIEAEEAAEQERKIREQWR